MKTLIKILLVCFILKPAALKAQDIDFTVSGKIGNYTAPYKAYLGFYRGGWHVDSSEIKSGRFSFRDHTNRTKFGHLYIKPQGSHIENIAGDGKKFYLEPGSISINSPDSIQNSIASGGKLSADFEEFSSILKRLNQEANSGLSAAPQQKEVWNNMKKARLTAFIKDHPQSPVSIDAIEEFISVMKARADVITLQGSIYLARPRNKGKLNGKGCRNCSFA